MRQRVIDAIRHKQTDVVPWNIELTTAFAGHFRKQTGCDDPDAFLGNHIIRTKYKLNTAISNQEEVDLFGVKWLKSKDGGDWGVVSDPPVKEVGFGRYLFPEINKELAIEQCRKLEQYPRNTFRIFSIVGSYYERAWSLRGMENILMDMIMNEAFTEELFERILNYNMELLDLVLEYDFEGIYLGDDWGQQKGLIMGPEMWRKYIKPGMKKMFEKVKSKGKFIILHSCGDLREILSELVEMGLDVYNSVQPEIYNLKEVKREYGQHLTFYGGISVQQLLPHGTVSEVREKVREVLKIMGRQGGYILSPANAVTPDIPVNNILAMTETARGFSW